MNLPNKLTMLRVILVPFFMFFAAFSPLCSLYAAENVTVTLSLPSASASPLASDTLPIRVYE